MTYVIAGMTVELWVIVVLSVVILGMFGDVVFVWHDRRNSFQRDINERMSRVSQMLEYTLTQGAKIMATLDQIIDRIAVQHTQLDSLNAFTEGLAQQIKDLQLNQADQAKIDALFAKVEASDQKIADAFTENTPAADVPPVAPPV